MLWEVDIYPATGEPDREAQRLATEAAELGLTADLRAVVLHGYLLEGPLDRDQVTRLARELLADSIVQQTLIGQPREAALLAPPDGAPGTLVYVLLKPGVMDPVALSTKNAIADYGCEVEAVRTFRKYWLGGCTTKQLQRLASKLLANEAIEQIVWGPLPMDRLELGGTYQFQRVTVPMRALTDKQLEDLSRTGQLYLSLTEMQTIRDHFVALGREPTDAELETVAQTWSEHCSHKTLAGRIRYQDDNGERVFDNMLKETIFAATEKIRQQLGAEDWCVSVFKDNAGVVKFDDEQHLVFKVETHNHPSAIEPYGGANTGLGGVIRDPLGTGLGARPIANTDVFCFAPPDTPPEQLPTGVLHPLRVLKGVVSGVRDYGNRMGIPTVNGAVYFDPRYLGNPLVYCGNVGLLPVDKVHKEPQLGDYIVVAGGRTGRDGIHGATFSSAELHEESETLSGGAVQIGNAIAEKMLLDVILQARDKGLFHAITDCGAGGLSSAVGEMGEELGAEVWLDKVPLKYAGLSYAEIWISEAQERMVMAVAPEQWDALQKLCAAEGVEATVIGKFVATRKLQLKYQEQIVGDVSMDFLHRGRPKVIREAIYAPPPHRRQPLPEKNSWDYTDDLLQILSSPNVASKEWIIRQYDHEVQGGSVIKPLVGVLNDGPSDAAVIRPNLRSRRGVVISCGMNPRLGDQDPYHMAASAIDEALRNCVAVGANPDRIAILDNFCWGNTDRPETLGTLVRAALACHDLAIAMGTPFISGKDSLNNEFRYSDDNGLKHVIAIPSSLLISAMGQVDDVRHCVTMDLKQAGNFLYQVGATYNELAGSHFALVHGLEGGHVPEVRAEIAKQTFIALHNAIRSGLVRACHDLSEGGLATAVAEMAFAGGLGARIFLGQVPHEVDVDHESQVADRNWSDKACNEPIHPLACMAEATAILLFSESNTRFVCEVPQEQAAAFEAALAGVPHHLIGEVTSVDKLVVVGIPTPAPSVDDPDRFELSAPLVIDAPLNDLKQAWQQPLRF